MPNTLNLNYATFFLDAIQPVVDKHLDKSEFHLNGMLELARRHRDLIDEELIRQLDRQDEPQDAAEKILNSLRDAEQVQYYSYNKESYKQCGRAVCICIGLITLGAGIGAIYAGMGWLLCAGGAHQSTLQGAIPYVTTGAETGAIGASVLSCLGTLGLVKGQLKRNRECRALKIDILEFQQHFNAFFSPAPLRQIMTP
jgi:hypothetical protein